MAQTNYHSEYGHYLTVWEADGNVQVCLKTNGMVTAPLYVDIETTEQHENTMYTLHTLATGKYSRRWPDGLVCCSDNEML